MEDGLISRLMMRVRDMPGVENRAVNALRNDGVYLMIQLLSLDERDIGRTPNLGKKSIDNLCQCVRNAGYPVGVLKNHMKDLTPSLADTSQRMYNSEDEARFQIDYLLAQKPDILAPLQKEGSFPVRALHQFVLAPSNIRH